MAIKRTRESEEMYLETIFLLHKGQPNVRAVDVCEELGYVKSSVSRGVNLLEKKGYIVRTRSSVDRRVVHLSLSKKGRLVYRLHRRFHKSMVMRITEGFNDEELKVMSKGLENLHAFLEELK